MRNALTFAFRCPHTRIHAAFVVLTVMVWPCLAGADAFPDTIFANSFEPCAGLECAQVSCGDSATTSISGIIYAPNGTLPLPNVEVYIPNALVGSLSTGPQYARCDVAPSGHPVIATLSGTDGKFKLSNVPVGTAMTLVIITGKWRRQIPVAPVTACIDTPLTSDLTRLPRDYTEGDIPHIAVATGSADAVECMVRKSGVADSEFSTSSGSGRIHLFAGYNGTNKFNVANGGTNFAAATALWSDLTSLSAYDQVMFGCEGDQQATSKPQTARDALKSYADAGGRVFLAHWQNYWIEAGAAPWNALASWSNNSDSSVTSMTADINPGFAQGAILSAWLNGVGASATSGTLNISPVRHTALSVDESMARKWIYLDAIPATVTPTVQYFSFTTPAESLPQTQQGRLLFTDMHSSPSDISNTSTAFPDGCTQTLAPQDKALLYATFDLQRCVDSTRQ